MVSNSDNDFWIAFDDESSASGQVLTSIIADGGQTKLALIGDHREELSKLSLLGLAACLTYYKQHENLQYTQPILPTNH